MGSSRLELISKKIIKPSFFKTPPPFRSHKLGLGDQLMNNVYMPIAFFYPNKHNKLASSQSNISTLLENSFSKVLASYYPLAGRAIDNLNIDCNEMPGATFIEAQLDCKMSQVSNNPTLTHQNVVFPSGMPWRTINHDESLLVAQLTHFNCGGKSISLSMSHKVSDGLTLCNFARHWADATKEGDKKPLPSPKFNNASILPPIEDPSFKPQFGSFQAHELNCVTKRFSFDSSKLGELKAKVSAETGIKNPSRVESVTALIHKCANAASSIVDPNSSKPSIFVQVVNMRPFMNPPVSSNTVGNFLNFFGAPFPESQDLTFSGLAKELNKAKVQFYEKFKGVTAKELRQEIVNTMEQMKQMSSRESSLEQYICTSMCRYPFYDVDYGWGKPERVIFGASGVKNFIILIDGPNGEGIDAFVPLEEKVMDVFQRDPQIIHFASSGYV
nr:BAHD acyltransferase [Echium plantagineum]